MKEKSSGGKPDFKNLFDNAPLGIFQTTSKGKANYINRQIAKMVAGSLIDINRVIKEFKSFFRRIIEEDIHLHLELAEQPLYVEADTSRLQQVLMNMVVNARDAMPWGGTLTITTDETDSRHIKTAGTAAEIQDPCVTITVTDTGAGMDDKTVKRIFEPFFTTKQQEKGTGLGLAMCYGIIKQHGGDITVWSDPEQGSSFTIYLPAASRPSPDIEAKGEKNIHQSNTNAKILVVEDDQEVLGLACKILEKNGYRTIGTKSARAAIDLAKNHPDEIHLILTDVIMPEMKGPEVYREIRRFHPEIKVIYMSGYTGNGLAGHGVVGRNKEFIQKPFSIKELGDMVNRVLSGT
ncbi:MAG: ATP-binding protein [Desulfobacterales bacterium]